METLFSQKYITVEKQGKRAWLTFNRERYLNAVNNEVNHQFNLAVRMLKEEPDTRVVVIHGLGRAFCTGLDLKAYSAGDIGMDYYQLWDENLRIIETTEKIFIVGMHGFCLGGALQLALASDIRISTPDCQIGLPAIRESIIPGLGPWRLPRYVGMGWAKRLTLSGESISGEKSHEIGLVDYMVPADNFFKRVDEISNIYLKTCSTGTRMSKLFFNASFDMDFESAFRYYRQLQERAHYSPDADEAKKAYLEKREPEWR